MGVVRFTKPCNDCPFRREAMAGWTGASEPEWFVEAALSEYPTDCPCHQTVDYENPDWRDTLEDASACAGALIFARNLSKMPRSPEQAEAVKSVEPDREGVFTSPNEFIEHHRKTGTGSWEVQ